MARSSMISSGTAEGRDGGFARAVERRVGELIEEHVCFEIEDAMPLLACGLPDCLRHMTFPGARWPQWKEAVKKAEGNIAVINDRIMQMV